MLNKFNRTSKKGFEKEKFLKYKIFTVFIPIKSKYFQAVKSIDKEFCNSKEKEKILSFIKKSKRGIMKGYSSNMSLSLINIAKKFNRDWVFRNANFKFEIPGSYVIKGSNGPENRHS